MSNKKIILLFFFLPIHCYIYPWGPKSIWEAHRIQLTSNPDLMKSRLSELSPQKRFILGCEVYGFYRRKPEMQKMALEEIEQAITQGARVDETYAWYTEWNNEHQQELALCIACHYQSFSLVNFLLKEGASPNITVERKYHKDCAPLDLIVRTLTNATPDRLNIIKTMIKYKATVTKAHIKIEEKNLKDALNYESYLREEEGIFIDRTTLLEAKDGIKHFQSTLSILQNTMLEG